jgi:hypothetical protein
MKLKFISEGRVGGQLVFEIGKTYEISNEFGSVDRWLRRNAAVVIEDSLVEEIPEVVVIEEIPEVVIVEEILTEPTLEVVEELFAIPEVKVENKKGLKTKKGK